MKQLSRALGLLSTLLVLCGCGGGTKASGPPAGSSSSGPPAQGLNAAGNWQFSATSTLGKLPTTIAGSIAQSGVSVSGAVHLDGSNCFDHMATIGLSGTVNGSDMALSSPPVSGQVVTFTGTVGDDAVYGTNSAFNGMYKVKGGCANGDEGSVTGVRIPYIGNSLKGTFTTSKDETFDVTGDEAQSSTPSAAGSFGITGTVTFGTSCFSSGTITPGTFPSASFIIGTSVALGIATDNGTVTFLGTLNSDGTEIRGAYSVVGGTCDDTGTAVLTISNPWDY